MSDESGPRTIMPRYSDRFLSHYLGPVKNDPSIAIIEIIANSWDAGALSVNITWPKIEENNGYIEIKDDGQGMTAEEFENRWAIASYDRKCQGKTVTLPDGEVRKVFGCNGIGRFGMFCFSNKYIVKTWKEGTMCEYEVCIDNPYKIQKQHSEKREGSGTIISCQKGMIQNFIDDVCLLNLIKQKFYGSHNFEVSVNNKFVDFSIKTSHDIEYEESISAGNVKITRCSDENIKGKGILFRVNGRTVGDPTWNLIEQVDPKRPEFKMVLVVDADCLEEYVLPDWTGFDNSEEYKRLLTEIKKVIEKSLSDILRNVSKNKKQQAIRSNLQDIKKMSPLSKDKLGKILDELLIQNPKVSLKDMDCVVKVVAKCESANCGFNLMEKLSSVEDTDINDLNKMLDNWTIREMKVVYDELSSRLKAVEQLMELTNKHVKEVQVLQPLFENNLWIFGPEYESCGFSGNTTLKNVLKNLLKTENKNIENGSKSPDIVILPDSSLALASSDKYGDDSEVNGYDKIVIIELKKGDSTINEEHKDQVKKYALALLNSGSVNLDVKIDCFVLGTYVDPRYNMLYKVGTNENIIIKPLQYSIVLRKAQKRLFDLREKMKKVRPDISKSNDGVIEEEINKEPPLDSYLCNQQL